MPSSLVSVSVRTPWVCTDALYRRRVLQVRVAAVTIRLRHRSMQPRSEIYQVTGPVERFAGQIASQGYVVGEYPEVAVRSDVAQRARFSLSLYLP